MGELVERLMLATVFAFFGSLLVMATTPPSPRGMTALLGIWLFTGIQVGFAFGVRSHSKDSPNA